MSEAVSLIGAILLTVVAYLCLHILFDGRRR